LAYVFDSVAIEHLTHNNPLAFATFVHQNRCLVKCLFRKQKCTFKLKLLQFLNSSKYCNKICCESGLNPPLWKL